MRKRSADAWAIRCGAAALAIFAACAISCAWWRSPESGGGGCVSGAASADTGRSIARAAFEFEPTGARRGSRYEGSVVCRFEDVASTLDRVLSAKALPARPSGLADLRVGHSSPVGLSFVCSVLPEAAPSEKVYFEIVTPRFRVVGEGYLAIVDDTWDTSWRPRAIAPADTTVPDSTAAIILDAARSVHPAGLEAMHFQWWIDGGLVVIKGEPVTSTRLPRGTHTVILHAQDRFGNLSTDTMVVRVE